MKIADYVLITMYDKSIQACVLKIIVWDSMYAKTFLTKYIIKRWNNPLTTASRRVFISSGLRRMRVFKNHLGRNKFGTCIPTATKPSTCDFARMILYPLLKWIF